MEAVREDEFAPVKNRTGEDSLESARRLLSELHWRWLASRGAETPQDGNGRPCEIHPSFALGPEDLPEDVGAGITKDGPVYLE